ncbi:MAG: DUF3107 domain-containing protein [Acidimicrobiia bacterium]|jgi:hypothetical protein
MKVRIGIADSDRVIELDVEDPAAYEREIETAFAGDSALLWFEDAKRRRIGVPRQRVAFVEIETETDRAAVGFGPGA